MADENFKEALLKEKYGKGVKNVTSFKFKKPDESKQVSEIMKKVEHARKLRKDKSVPEASLTNHWKNITKDLKHNAKLKKIVKDLESK